MINEASGLTGGYNKREFGAGPRTYADTVFLDLIKQSSGLLTADTRNLLVADIMSGPGGVGLALLKEHPQHSYYFFDLARRQLEKINNPNSSTVKVQADARLIPVADNMFDLEVARYAVKDLTKEDQPKALLEIFRTLKPGGNFTLADMVAPSVETKYWLNMQHAKKQEFSGRDPSREGICHIPTEDEWIVLLRNVGFDVSVIGRHVSCVTTSDWVKGKQVTAGQLQELNTIILEAPESIRRTFNIREEDSRVRIDYPIIVIKGIKSI
ncbi:class I SAM-dependent methyltransferase [Patescibacteria group bacterium]|nr:class I SAM-dependent methyltransferase [Patescibacteria group bacterium]MBU1472200.1 class I SAM-dependent methyltransferase [Patescibacteria group bacterium]MBU2459594.1 class I SAM-dependent methyltransferase [Patescibacteria group bacterium]MBU2544165.1 class I SAM-dependent methyltransferase [Patescibacteria group bacterium]